MNPSFLFLSMGEAVIPMKIHDRVRVNSSAVMTVVFVSIASADFLFYPPRSFLYLVLGLKGFSGMCRLLLLNLRI